MAGDRHGRRSAVAVIFLCADAFADALIASGSRLGISDFFLVQWVAPLASEAPELIIATIYAWRLRAAVGLGALVSSKVNQWTLLVGSLPIAFAVASSSIHGLPLGGSERQELALTAAQSVFGVAVLGQPGGVDGRGDLAVHIVHRASSSSAAVLSRARRSARSGSPTPRSTWWPPLVILVVKRPRHRRAASRTASGRPTTSSTIRGRDRRAPVGKTEPHDRCLRSPLRPGPPGRDHFDVLVIGGGVTGAGVALDAASRGLRTALVERDDLASGTSSKSSKMVHGGLRYLQQGEYRLVYEALAERQRLLATPPTWCKVLPFLIPCSAGTAWSTPPWPGPTRPRCGCTT